LASEKPKTEEGWGKYLRQGHRKKRACGGEFEEAWVLKLITKGVSKRLYRADVGEQGKGGKERGHTLFYKKRIKGGPKGRGPDQTDKDVILPMGVGVHSSGGRGESQEVRLEEKEKDRDEKTPEGRTT